MLKNSSVRGIIMEYGRFQKFSDEDLRRILNDAFSGYSNEELAEARRELESRSTPVKTVLHCGKCGAKLEDNQNFCQKCGKQLGGYAPRQTKKPGALGVLLYFAIVAGIVFFCIWLAQ